MYSIYGNYLYWGIYTCTVYMVIIYIGDIYMYSIYGNYLYWDIYMYSIYGNYLYWRYIHVQYIW